MDGLRVQGLGGAPGRQCVGVGREKERELIEDGEDALEGRAGKDGRDIVGTDGRAWARRRGGGDGRSRAQPLHHGSPWEQEEGTWVTSEFEPIITFYLGGKHNDLIGNSERKEGVKVHENHSDAGREAGSDWEGGA